MEVGVWVRSDFERQLAADTSLFLVTIEPTKRSALSTVRGLDRYGAHGRYTMLQSACSTHETPRTLTFHEHPGRDAQPGAAAHPKGALKSRWTLTRACSSV